MMNVLRVGRISAGVLLAAGVAAAGLGCGGGSSSTDAQVDAGDAQVDASGDTGSPDAGCASSAACADSTAPICREGSCGGCLTDAECQGGPGLAICLDDGSCAECGRDTDCDMGFCVAGGVCAQCRGNDDCAVTAPLCAAGACASCADADGCTTAMTRDEWLSAFCAIFLPAEDEFAPFRSWEAAICSGRSDVFPPLRVLTAGIDSGQIEISPEGLAACHAAVGSPGGFQTCVDALVAQVAPGGACFTDTACVGGFCDRSASCPGVCVASPTEGESCVSSTCVPGLSCISDVCRPIPGDGEACGGICTDGLMCNRTTNVCEALHSTGGACLVTSDCEASLRCVAGACVARSAGGEACDESRGSVDCADGLRCVANVCRIPKADGDACSLPRECALGSRCQDGMCRPILTPGRRVRRQLGLRHRRALHPRGVQPGSRRGRELCGRGDVSARQLRRRQLHGGCGVQLVHGRRLPDGRARPMWRGLELSHDAQRRPVRPRGRRGRRLHGRRTLPRA